VMLAPDFCDQEYTAEVLRAQGRTDLIVDGIARLTVERGVSEQIESETPPPATILHSFAASRKAYHRTSGTIEVRGEGVVTVPRTKTIRGEQHFLYDVIISQRGPDVLVAVPYHRLAESFFVRIDKALAGRRAVYERLDITKLVVKLGQTGVAEVADVSGTRKLQIGLTRCHVAYSDVQGGSRDLQHLLMSGSQLGASDVYRYVVAPILNPGSYRLQVTPILLGFSLFVDGARRTSAVTDRHGNFKLWIGPGATRVQRLFSLLDAIGSMAGIISTTSNLPILQSRAISEAEAERP